MIEKFDKSTALLLVDVQEGVNDVEYYGGPSGKRYAVSLDRMAATWKPSSLYTA